MGTLDLSLLNISDGIFQVLGSAGNTHLGGVDFDNKLISFCLNEFKKKNNLNLDTISPMSMQKLKQACEEAKKRLSETTKTSIIVKEFYNNKNLFITLTREQFEKICRDLFILCLKPADDILKTCEINKENIDDIILVGGCTRIPLIKQNLETFFGKKIHSSINPDEVVAAGAAIQGYILSHANDPFSENLVLLDIIPLSLGVETIGGVMNVLIPSNSVIPIKRKRKYTTDSDYETSVKIKVFEGERKMTKDNFLVGEFELIGLDSEPRGIVQIEITFSVDINGIITVSAADLKNDGNKKIVNINSNKGRLSPEKIKELIELAKKSEVLDRIEKEKKQLFYEIEDLCSNIKINTNNDEFKLKEKDKETVFNDINKIYDWLKEKNFAERSQKEYLKILDRMKKKYGTLILKVTHENDNVKAATSNTIESTTVYGNDEDEEDTTIYEEIENEELGIKDIEDEEIKKEIKRLREILINLCYSIFDILSGNNIKLNQDHVTELKDYIDDILLWSHVKEKISISEYKQKIDEVNKICNDIVDKYDNTNIFENTNDMNIKTKRDELERLCYALMSSIMCNILALHEDKSQELKNKINENFEWLVDMDIQNEKHGTVIPENEYQARIDELNIICNNLYDSIINININSNTIV
jgi:heat shock protein 1/8